MPTYDLDETTKGSDSGSDLSGGRITFTAKRSWTIIADENGLSAETVRAQLQGAAGGLPRNGDPHPDNGALSCKKVNCKRVAPFYFEADANYQSLTFDAGDQEDPPEFPWNARAKVNYRSVTSEAETDEDFDGNAIVNPGTEEPVSGITRRITDVLAVIEKSFLVFSGPVIRNYADKTNTNNYLGFPAGEGLVMVIQANPNEFDGNEYYDVTAEILFRTPYRTTSEKAWYHRRILKGFYEVIGSGGDEEVFRIVDAEENPVTQPFLLDADGKRLPAGGTPVEQETKLQGSIDYDGMGFF